MLLRTQFESGVTKNNMENTEKIRIVAATGIPMLDNELSEQNELAATKCVLKGELEETIKENSPQIVIVSDKLSGEESIIKLLIKLKNQYHMVRFIYLAGNVDTKDRSRVDSLGMLVLVGVYDIVISQKINIDLVMDTIKYPKSEQAVAFLTQNLLNAKYEISNVFNGLEYESYDDSNADSACFPNVYVVTSVKPGTGKSFLSVNLACAIAKYGKIPQTGARPKVALVEADMQTLSIGTLLSIDEDGGSLKAAMEAVSTIFQNNVLTDDMEKRKRVNRIIRRSMNTYKELANLDVLVGSSITPEEIDHLAIIPEYFTYILDELRKDYDYVVVDTNSSIFHVSSFPILQRAKECFYVLNLDFNNVRNNLRYKNVLKELGISDKVKYILNENIENTKEFWEQGVEDEELNFTAEDIENKYFTLVAKVPILPKTVFLNRLYEGTPVVLDSNKKEVTNKAKLEIMKIANSICPMDDEMTKLEKIIVDRENGKKGFFSKLFEKKEKSKEKKETESDDE